MSAIESARAHFAAIGVRHVDVPEWGERGADGVVTKPLRIYFNPMTLAEKQKLQNVGEREGYIARLADALIMKALDAQGKPLYTIDDKHALRNGVSPDVLADVVREIMSTPTPDEAAKNSTGTPSSS